jgi:hypothetical protein
MTAALSVVPLAARTLGTARDHDSLVDLLLARKAELGLSDAWVDENALSAGHCQKLSSRERNLGRSSLDGLLIVLGCSLVLVEDADRVRLIRPQWEQRKESKVHPSRSPAAAAAIERCRRTILRELNVLSARTCR